MANDRKGRRPDFVIEVSPRIGVVLRVAAWANETPRGYPVPSVSLEIKDYAGEPLASVELSDLMTLQTMHAQAMLRIGEMQKEFTFNQARKRVRAQNIESGGEVIDIRKLANSKEL